jgi:hypothetical protein
LVTRPDEYAGMVQSAFSAGFCGPDVEFLYLDNSSVNRFDGFSGANKFIDVAKGKYLIYCHQDVLFDFDGFDQLCSKIEELNFLDPGWAILGNAGKKCNSEAVVRITDPGVTNMSKGKFPEKVMTVDENFMVINLSAKLGCTKGLSGFHLYGADLCCNAYDLGYSVYVIDFHLRHKSAGNADESYYRVQESLIDMYKKRKKARVVQAMCSRFFVSSSGVLNRVCNRSWLLNLHKSLLKKMAVDKK